MNQPLGIDYRVLSLLAEQDCVEVTDGCEPGDRAFEDGESDMLFIRRAAGHWVLRDTSKYPIRTVPCTVADDYNMLLWLRPAGHTQEGGT